MLDANNFDGAATELARRILFITLALALAGAGVGVLGTSQGVVAGGEAILVACSFVFSLGALVTLLVFRSVPLQAVATVATGFFLINLCIGIVIATCGQGQHLNIFVYLLWFFPLLVFNKLVNQPAIGRILAKILIIFPLVLVASLLPRWMAVLRPEQRILLGVFCLSYCCYASTIDLITRYREKYLLERERVGSLKVEADILESISDCFISLDSDARLIYLNDAACAELAVERRTVLNHTLSNAVPGFLSATTITELKAASIRDFASFFEVPDEESGLWYDLRCFPRPDGLSIYFRNITDSVLSRLKLDEANSSLRRQAELLDKAQDAILVADLDSRITYWNKSAERLYGWTSEEVIGRMAKDIFRYQATDLEARIESIRRDGEWIGEISQFRRDGSKLIVESRLTLVAAQDGKPQSVLAINTDVTAWKADEARIEYLAFYDVLSGLPNRQLLRDRLAEALANPANKHKVGVLMYIDLDDFKTLNDTMGHDVGDELLHQVARRLTDCLDPFDTAARVGGDEFVVMLWDLYEDARAAAAAAEIAGNKVLGAFGHPFILGTCEREAGASIGATFFSGESDTIDQLLKQTDLAVYRAKATGGNNLCFFEPGMQIDVDNRAALRWDLRRAFQNGEFQLHYQAQVDSDTVVVGAEALIRWFHPLRGRISPDEFIPLAEEAGLIVELGCWALETACLQIAEWSTNPSMKNLTIAVNVSVRQLLDPLFVKIVRETVRASGANPRRLKLEITESSTVEKIGEVIAIMKDLKRDGVTFSLDDFGTGYSSLSHLQHLPLDQLKIDRSFVNNVLTHSKDAAIARTIIMLGSNLGLSVIAEGVETEAQRTFLQGEGCHLYQGFLYSPAITVAGFEAFVAASTANIHLPETPDTGNPIVLIVEAAY
jgi:diguanylate cyclase (GGDEF)-like protein/PAS domain S-box-containing protein